MEKDGMILDVDTKLHLNGKNVGDCIYGGKSRMPFVCSHFQSF